MQVHTLRGWAYNSDGRVTHGAGWVKCKCGCTSTKGMDATCMVCRQNIDGTRLSQAEYRRRLWTIRYALGEMVEERMRRKRRWFRRPSRYPEWYVVMCRERILRGGDDHRVARVVAGLLHDKDIWR